MRWRKFARCLPPAAPTRTKSPRPSARSSARLAVLSIRTPRSASPSTAHAAKFPDAVEAACGVRLALPEFFSDLDTRPERVTVLPADQSAVERFILQTS